MKNKRLIFTLIVVCLSLILSSCTVNTTAHVHSYGEWEVTKEATCTQNGLKKRTCSCGDFETEEIQATGHTYGEWTVVTQATCTTDGQEKRTCACGETETRVIKATGHTYGEWTVVKAATCLEKGTEKRVCACGAEETRDIEIADHTYGELIDEVESTCTTNGMEAHYECSVCHKLFTPRKEETTAEDLKIALLGHKIVKYSVTQVTDLTTLQAGDKIVLVSGENGCGAGSKAFTVTINEGQLLPNSNFEVFTLATGSVDNTWALKNSSGKYVGAYKQNSYNLGTGNSSNTAKTSYKLTIDENGIVTFEVQDTDAASVAKYIIYDSENNSFSRLTEGTANVKIYKYVMNDYNPAVANSCTEDGHVAYYKCENCDYMEDESGQELKSVVVAKTGHDLTATWAWASNYSYARITITCANENNAALVDAVKVYSEKTSTASCTEAGKITYTVTYEFDGETYTDKHEEDVEAGHSYFLRIDDTYVEATSFDASVTYYTYDAEDEVYTACKDLTSFAEGTTYYTLVEAHNDYSTVSGEVTTYGCKLEYDTENSKYVLKYTCLICGEVETKDAVVKSVKDAKALTAEYTDLFLVQGIVLGPVHNGNRSCLLIQDETTGEVYEICGFHDGVIYDSSTKNFVNTFVAGDKVVIPVQVKKYVCDGEADHNKLSLEAMLSFTNYDVANCIVSHGNTIKALKNTTDIVTITSQDELEAFLFNEDDTYKTESVYKVVKLSGLVSIYKGSNGFDFMMGNSTGKSCSKINEKTIRVRVGNEPNILSKEFDAAVFGETKSSGKSLFTGDLYLVYFGGTKGYPQFVLVSEDDVVVRQIEKTADEKTAEWTNPTVTTYKVGTDYSLAGAQVVINKYYECAAKDFVATETITDLTSYVVTDETTYDKDKTGNYKVKVSVQGIDHEFDMVVQGKSLVSIAAPTQTIVYYSELTIDGLILKYNDTDSTVKDIKFVATYDDSSTEEVLLSAATITGTLADGANNALTITYQTATVAWTVTLESNEYGALVTDASTLAANDVIIIAAYNKNFAIGTENNGKGCVAFTTTASGNLNYLSTIQTYKVVAPRSGTADNTFSFMRGTSSYYFMSSSKEANVGNMMYSNSDSNKGSATYTVAVSSDGKTTLTALSTTYKYIQFTSSETSGSFGMQSTAYTDDTSLRIYKYAKHITITE